MPKHRDMSEKEFETALRNRGFQNVEHGIQISRNVTVAGIKVSGDITTGAVMRWSKSQNTYVMDRRQSLKRAIAEAGSYKRNLGPIRS